MLLASIVTEWARAASEGRRSSGQPIPEDDRPHSPQGFLA